MPLYRFAHDRIEVVPTTTFHRENIKERGDLQRLLRQQIDILGDDLLVVAEEYALFQDSRRRIDLLAVDRTGTLVVVELKRTDDGGHMDLQALRYAAMVSTMSFDQLVDAYSHYNAVDVDEARQLLREWMEESAVAEELSDKVRIVLVSADFGAEVTSTVLWLNQQYATDIRCYRLVAYRLDDDVLVDLQQIIPLPEAADFQVQQRQKGATTAAARAIESGRDFTKYDLRFGAVWDGPLSKQEAVRKAAATLHDAGVPIATLKTAAAGNRWIAVRPKPGESVKDAFRREHPARGGHYWFEPTLTEGDVVWVMPRLGGRRTEQHLTRLAELRADGVAMSWRRSGEAAEPDPG